ncbi:MAG TPA: anthranilate synthase component I family protein [Sphingobacteriaceae bacterium]|nr:anthranilate synthase component I family protein [Sphingobacteriaceae bacterium]
MHQYFFDDTVTLKEQAFNWAYSFDVACYFDSNNYSDPYSAFDILIAAGAKEELSTGNGNAFENLGRFLSNREIVVPGYLTYDLKNELEDLVSLNTDHLQFPELYFFIPEHLILFKGNQVTIYSDEPEKVWRNIQEQKTVTPKKNNITIQSRFTKPEYLKTVNLLKKHIQKGDIYEITFCQEFFADNVELDPLQIFQSLNNISPTPFANFFKIRDKYIISATPERFLSKRGRKLISQPIKGTAARSVNQDEDLKNKESLYRDEKEKAENVMIVDLVRNDLTRSAEPGSVTVKELFGVYSFKQVHQMISTVVCQAAYGISNQDILKNTFPMGSMTGAPKIRAMQLIEQYERTRRGVFSGTVGYISPNGDFDFNVVIRTILYNKTAKYLSFQVGSAITFECSAEKEYEECLLKASAIQAVLN